MNVEDDEAGRLAGFRARFGRGYDIGREDTAANDAERAPSENVTARPSAGEEVAMDDNGFGEEEDANLLDLISSFGQGQNSPGGGGSSGE